FDYYGAAVLAPVAGAGYQWLALEGDVTADFSAGKWYEIDGRRDKAHAMRSGTWEEPVTHGVYKAHEYAYFNENMVGWLLQPDVNQQVYLPVKEIDVAQHTLTVA